MAPLRFVSDMSPRAVTASALLLVVCAAVLAFLPTWHNGFLIAGFDDQLVLDDPHVRQLDAAHLWGLLTSFRHANYVPLTMLTFALQYPFAGLDPAPYHLVNILLHAANAALVWWLVRRLIGNPTVATVAALIFAVHPMQLEAVTLVIQRKTLLSSSFYLLAVLAWLHWRDGGARAAYAAALACAIAAAAAKPTAVTLPAALVLLDLVRTGRTRVRDLLPFAAVALVFSWAATAASQAVGALIPPHDGSWLSHTLIVARSTADAVVALFLPLQLAPIYYYRAGSAVAPLNVLALLAGALLLGTVTVRARRDRWTAFCVWWFVVVLLPQSNLVPLAQLRPDRYFYLSIVGFALWVALRLDALCTALPAARGWRVVPLAVAGAWLLLLGTISIRSAAVWRDDVTAWHRVVEHHPWSATAHMMLGRVHDVVRRDPRAAEHWYRAAIRVQPEKAEPYLHLARLYAQHGAHEPAAAAARQFLARDPAHPERAAAEALLAAPAPPVVPAADGPPLR